MVDKQFLQDTRESLQQMSGLPATHHHYLLQYDYEVQGDAVTYTLYDHKAGRIFHGPLSFNKKDALGKDDFNDLFNVYMQYFVPESPLELPPGIFDWIKDAWVHLFTVLVDPVATQLPVNTHCRIFTRWNVVIEKQLKYINIPALFDAFFRMSDVSGFDNVHFVNVHQPSFANFFKALYKWKCPQVQDMHLLYGIDNLLSPGNTGTPYDKRMCWFLFRQAFAAAEAAGARVEELTSRGVFDTVFDKSHNKAIQVISHFHYSRIFFAPTGKNRQAIRVADMEGILQKKHAQGTLKDGIMLDAVTCNNYLSLKPLLTAGVSYISFSFHKVSASIVALMLYEMYTGRYSNSQSRPQPYLTGSNYLQEAWSKVLRALNREMLIHKNIKIP